MKRKLTILFAFTIMMSLMSSAEAQSFGGPESMKGKVVVGGDLGLGLYGNSFYFGVAPQAGYRLTRSLEVGVRLGYDLYYHWRDYYYGNYFCHYFSGSAYANYEIYKGIYLHVEDEEMCSLTRGKALNPTAPRWYNSVFVGAGYRQYASAKDFVFYSILYNLSWDYGYGGNYDSPYASPFVIRMGYCFAL